MNKNIYIYIAVMAVVTYLIRVLPLTLIRGKIKNRFLCSFLHYVPYVTLAAMTFPAILYATENIYSAVIGFVVAIVLAFLGRSLFTVASVACIAVFLTEFFMK